MKLADYGCRALLRLYPRDIRETRGAEMRQTFLDVCAGASEGGRVAIARASFGELVNLVKAALDVRRGAPRVTAGRAPRSPRHRRSTMWVDDVRHAVRRLRSSRATAGASVLMLGLAIGLTTSMFTLVDALMIRTVPFPEADRLARVGMRSKNGGRWTVSMAVFNAWRDTGVFDAIEGTSTDSFILGSGASMTERPAAFVSPGLLPLLGVRPVLGRLFQADEGQPGSDDRILISEGIWRGMFAADPSIVGRRITVDGESLTVVGVLPASFRFPAWKTALWRPLDFHVPPAREATRLPMPIARVRAGVPMDDAMKIATAAAHRAESLPPNQWAAPESLASPYGTQYSRQAAPILGACAAVVFLVLCANVSGLLLARLERRRRELGVALALGASRARLVREAFIESGALAAGGLVVGVILAVTIVAVGRAYLPETLLAHTLNPLDVDMRALALASCAAVAAACGAGLLPALLAPRIAPMIALRDATRSGTEGVGGRTLRRTLLIGEVALACTLLLGATLLVRSFMNLASADRGLDTTNVIVGWISGVGGEDATREQRADRAGAIEAALRDVPGVRHVALAYGAPPNGGGWSTGEWLSDIPGATAVNATVESYSVGRDFFDIYRIPILHGRKFEPGDPPDVVIVGERFAALMWPRLSPVGRTFTVFKRQYRVVGVARELHLPTTEERYDRPEYYRPLVPGLETIAINIRCDGVCPDSALIRQRVRDVQADANVWNLGSLDAGYQEHVESPRAAAILVLVFAVIAAIAVAGGLFAVLSYLAGRRRREFGVRLALGAHPRQLRGVVLREGLRMVLAGALLGSLVAWWMTRSLASLMYGVTRSDAVSWLAVLIALGLVSLAASWWPAARAARVDPSILLREE